MRALAALILVLAAAPDAAAAVVVRASVDRAAVSLGDPFVYTVEAEGARDLALIADTGPFVPVSAPKRSRDGGRVRIEQRLVCVDRGCAPGDRARRVALPRARAVSGARTTLASPVAITLRPRVPAEAVRAPRARYRVDDGLAAVSAPWAAAAGGLGALALAATLASVLLVVRDRRAVRAPATARRAAVGLGHALRLLRESARRPAPDRRRAADLVARAAAARGGADAATEATRVAWSAPEPAPPEVAALADRVESTLGSGS